jgi:biopolymer transport protein ExbD
VALPLSWHLDAAQSESAATRTFAGDGNQQKAAQQADDEAKKVAKKQTAEESMDIKLVLAGNDEVYFKGKDTSLAFADFESKLVGSKLAERDDVVFTIVCKDGVTMEEVHKLGHVLRGVWEMPKVRFVSDQGKAVPMYLPSAQVVEKLAQIDAADQLHVKAIGQETVVIGDKKYPMKKVGMVAQKQLAENPHLVVALDCKPATPYEDFAFVLAALKEAGATKVAIMPMKVKKTAPAPAVATP